MDYGYDLRTCFVDQNCEHVVVLMLFPFQNCMFLVFKRRIVQTWICQALMKVKPARGPEIRQGFSEVQASPTLF